MIGMTSETRSYSRMLGHAIAKVCGRCKRTWESEGVKKYEKSVWGKFAKNPG